MCWILVYSHRFDFCHLIRRQVQYFFSTVSFNFSHSYIHSHEHNYTTQILLYLVKSFYWETIFTRRGDKQKYTHTNKENFLPKLENVNKIWGTTITHKFWQIYVNAMIIWNHYEMNTKWVFIMFVFHCIFHFFAGISNDALCRLLFNWRVEFSGEPPSWSRIWWKRRIWKRRAQSHHFNINSLESIRIKPSSARIKPSLVSAKWWNFRVIDIYHFVDNIFMVDTWQFICTDITFSFGWHIDIYRNTTTTTTSMKSEKREREKIKKNNDYVKVDNQNESQ